MSDVSSCDPHKEEDEGYLAAEAGLALSANPYPRGTIRHAEWSRGWQIRNEETATHDTEAPDPANSLAENPHPRGTIRHAEWRKRWQARNAAAQRAMRLGRDR